MIDISLKTHRELYVDYTKCLKFLNELDFSNYSYPDDITNFHIYSEFKTDKEVLALKSYFATQNLEKTKLVVWSDYDISDNPRIQIFKNKLDLRIWNPQEEAKGTILENRHDILSASDSKHYLQSDLLRILALKKYGGTWFDMDVLLLRDFKPLLDQEYMYMWGSEIDFANEGACATVLSLKKDSKLANKLLEEITVSPIRHGSTCWGKDMFAALYRKYSFDIMPASFFNIEWCINSHTPGLGDQIESTWFLNPVLDEKHLFLDSFGWHWHNSSKKNYDTVKGSKFDILNNMIEKLLADRGIC